MEKKSTQCSRACGPDFVRTGCESFTTWFAKKARHRTRRTIVRVPVAGPGALPDGVLLEGRLAKKVRSRRTGWPGVSVVSRPGVQGLIAPGANEIAGQCDILLKHMSQSCGLRRWAPYRFQYVWCAVRGLENGVKALSADGAGKSGLKTIPERRVPVSRWGWTV